MISPSAEQIRELLTGRGGDYETILNFINAQDRALEEAQRDIAVYKQTVDGVAAQRDAIREVADAQLTAAQGEIARLKADRDALHQFPCGHFVYRIRRGDGTLTPASEEPKCLPCLRAEQAEAERARPPEAIRLAKEATNGWACYAKRLAEHNEIARLHQAIADLEAPTRAEGHDRECERELTSHGYTPCRCDLRAGICYCRKNPCECILSTPMRPSEDPQG